MAREKLILDYVYEHEARKADQVFLTQPIGQGQTINYTWREVMNEARRMAAHLQARQLGHGARVAILSKNCAHFIMAELAIWMAGGTTVAIFPTETADNIRHVLTHSEASLLFIGKLDTLAQQLPGIPQDMPCIAFPLAPTTAYLSWDTVVERTQPLQGRPARNPSDIGILMYTSGSTGQAKGALHSFAGITAASCGIAQDTQARISPHVKNRMLSYMPLAHVFERAWVEGASLVHGDTHLFFAESMDTFLQDVARARPITFGSVPRLWLKFQQGVFTKIPAKKLDRLLSIPLLGRLVGRKVLKGLGLHHVRLAGSGSAPIPPELIRWYRRLGLNLIEGYAMTEDFAYSHNSNAQDNAPGCVGLPLAGVQVRLSEEGEVLIKSPGQFVGYFKRPDLDAQAFTEDGFFRTGDRGEYTPGGLLRLTGRLKELFKTSKGKYVAPAPIENLLNACPLVEMSMVSGVGQPAPYGLIVLAEAVRAKAQSADAREDIQTELTALLRSVNQTLPEYEKLQTLVVAPEPWTQESGTLTPTLKIRRASIEASVTHQIAAWYANPAPVQWA